MSDKRTTREWRAHLTPAEKKRLSVIETRLAAMKTKTADLRAERDRIQNRATVRAGK
jgi:hypothetical protein